jgi:hypothetical protein
MIFYPVLKSQLTPLVLENLSNDRYGYFDSEKAPFADHFLVFRSELPTDTEAVTPDCGWFDITQNGVTWRLSFFVRVNHRENKVVGITAMLTLNTLNLSRPQLRNVIHGWNANRLVPYFGDLSWLDAPEYNNPLTATSARSS